MPPPASTRPDFRMISVSLSTVLWASCWSMVSASLSLRNDEVSTVIENREPMRRAMIVMETATSSTVNPSRPLCRLMASLRSHRLEPAAHEPHLGAVPAQVRPEEERVRVRIGVRDDDHAAGQLRYRLDAPVRIRSEDLVEGSRLHLLEDLLRRDIRDLRLPLDPRLPGDGHEQERDDQRHRCEERYRDHDLEKTEPMLRSPVARPNPFHPITLEDFPDRKVFPDSLDPASRDAPLRLHTPHDLRRALPRGGPLRGMDKASVGPTTAEETDSGMGGEGRKGKVHDSPYPYPHASDWTPGTPKRP